MADLGRPEDRINLPFEQQAPTPMLDEEVVWAGGVIVMGAVAPVPGVGPKPALVFRFVKPEGGFYTATVLVCDDGQIATLPELVAKAVEGARAAARAAS